VFAWSFAPTSGRRILSSSSPHSCSASRASSSGSVDKVKAPSLAVALTLLALPLVARDPTRFAPKDAPSTGDVPR